MGVQTREGMEDERNEKTERKGKILMGDRQRVRTHNGWGYDYERVMTGDWINRKEGMKGKGAKKIKK